MSQVKKRRSASPKKYGFRSNIIGNERDLLRQRIDVTVDEIAARCLRIKRAIVTLLCAEGHVNVKGSNWFRFVRGHDETLRYLQRNNATNFLSNPRGEAVKEQG